MASDYNSLYQSQKSFFHTGVTKPLSFRKEMLQKMETLVRQYEPSLIEALHKDLRKHAQEAYMTEIGGVYEEIHFILKRLKSWMKPKTRLSPLFLFPSKGTIYPDPLGQVLIITPWNYPVLLSLRGVIGAMAAGNTIILKPSEVAAHTSAVLAEMINNNFPAEYLHVLEGDGVTVVPALLNNFHFDHVMYTGSTAVGKLIMEMCSRNLSPVTLELGGKSPCIVTAGANLKIAAKRIVWGKMVNAGQTCVAPDYLVVEESIKEDLVRLIQEEIKRGYGEDPQQGDSYPRMVSDRRFEAVAKYLSQGKLVSGGKTDAADRYIQPTILEDVSMEDTVMKDEIFGPVLPVFTFKTDGEVLQLVEKNPYPLALYVFSGSKSRTDYFIKNIRFGGGAVNETILHLGNSKLPFGGVGYSGIGSYHGKHSFDTFTHYKSVLNRANWFEPSFRHAPFTNAKASLWKWMLGKF